VRTPEAREARKTEREGMRGLLENRRHVGAPTNVPALRACGVLRFVKEQACHEAFPRDATSHHAFDRAG